MGNESEGEAWPAESNEIVEASFWPSYSFTEALLALALHDSTPQGIARLGVRTRSMGFMSQQRGKGGVAWEATLRSLT